MPRVFRWSPPLLQADLDAFGELRSSALLRLLQESATRASSDGGFDPAYYDRTRSTWIVRRTALTHLAPIRYGATLELATWIADFRRVRSQREYEVHVDDTPVVRAHTDWVLVDERGRPRRIPTDMQETFLPEGGASLERPAFPALDPPADAARTSRRVQWHELDGLRHVNNANYVAFIEQAAVDAAAARGWPLVTQLAEGARFRAVAHDLEYLDAAFYDDELTVITWPVADTATSLERASVIVRDGTPRPLLRATSRYAWVALDGGALRPLPDALRAPRRG